MSRLHPLRPAFRGALFGEDEDRPFTTVWRRTKSAPLKVVAAVRQASSEARTSPVWKLVPAMSRLQARSPQRPSQLVWNRGRRGVALAEQVVAYVLILKPSDPVYHFPKFSENRDFPNFWKISQNFPKIWKNDTHGPIFRKFSIFGKWYTGSDPQKFLNFCG